MLFTVYLIYVLAFFFVLARVYMMRRFSSYRHLPSGHRHGSVRLKWSENTMETGVWWRWPSTRTLLLNVVSLCSWQTFSPWLATQSSTLIALGLQSTAIALKTRIRRSVPGKSDVLSEMQWSGINDHDHCCRYFDGRSAAVCDWPPVGRRIVPDPELERSWYAYGSVKLCPYCSMWRHHGFSFDYFCSCSFTS